MWNELIKSKTEGIEDSINASAISLGLLGSDQGSELKKEDLVVDFVESNGGDLNISWKLKQSFGITVARTFNGL